MQNNPSSHENKREINREQNNNIRTVQNINSSNISEPSEDPDERYKQKLAQIITLGLESSHLRRAIHS